MVFDVTEVDHPTLLGRSPIFGTPVEMIIREGIATVVVADWYGATEDGVPFHGSIVRGLDARDPSNIKLLGEAKLGGWVKDTRIVGDVLYAVSEDFGWSYAGAEGSSSSGSVTDGVSGIGVNQSKIIVSSVSFAGGSIQAKDLKSYAGVRRSLLC